MTEIQIPEEIWSKILEYVVWPIPMDVHLDESEEMAESSLGGPLDARPPHILLVNRRWHRIATPIFYRYILLSTPKQVQSLGGVLRKHPQIRLFVRHLRLEGGYGKLLGDVPKYVGSVGTISVNVFVELKTRTEGILQSLELLRPGPKRLYLHHFKPTLRKDVPWNKNTGTVTKAVSRCLRKWPELKRVYVAQSFCDSPFRNKYLAQALSICHTLKIVSIHYDGG